MSLAIPCGYNFSSFSVFNGVLHLAEKAKPWA
jgi:hypothetical protein